MGLSHESSQSDSQLEGLGSVYIGHIFWSNVILLHILWVTHGNSKETYNKAWEVIYCCLHIFVLPLFFLNHSVLGPMGLFLAPILHILVEYGGTHTHTHKNPVTSYIPIYANYLYVHCTLFPLCKYRRKVKRSKVKAKRKGPRLCEHT